MNFEQRILQFIKKNKLIAPRGRVVIGVSGGADSMALMCALAGLRHDLGVALHALHFNHKFRPESLRDEQFVVKWCQQLNIPLTIGYRQGGKIKHLSEDDARQMRFEFFVKSAKHLKAQSVALAHTRNDLAETVLMRLMRGSGLYGLRAIMPRRCLGGVEFIRPLMGVNRRDVEEYLKIRKTPFCMDATNRLTKYERNRVRHELLPLLAKEYNPQIIDALSDLAATAGEDYNFISAHAHRQFEKNVTVSLKKVKMDLKGVGRQHPAVLRLILRKMVESLGQDQAALSFEHVHALENLAVQNGNGAVDLPYHLRAYKIRASLELRSLI